MMLSELSHITSLLNTPAGRLYSYGSLNEGQTAFAPNNISYADGTNVNEQYGIGGSLQRRETTIPNSTPSEELYRFGADGNLRLYSYDRLFYSLYGYDGGTARTYKYSFDLNPNWVNGRLESVNFNPRTAMFYPNAYINFNNNGYYTKHYYNGMERIASRLGDQNLQIHTHDPELQDRKDWQDSLIRKNIVEITGYEFLPVGEEQDPDDPKPVFELPQIGLNNLIPNTSSVYYYHPNHLGSTCYVTDGNASVQQGFLYAPFGEITNEYNAGWQSGVLPKYSFNAKELDEETGMYYYEARYYQPPVFTSRDRLFEKYPFMSPYGYCMNNPIKYIDPSGDSCKFANKDDEAYVKQLLDPKNRKLYSKEFSEKYKKLEESTHIYYFESWEYDYTGKRKESGLFSANIELNTSKINFTKGETPETELKGFGAGKYRVLFEEVYHAWKFENNDNKPITQTCHTEAEAWKFSALAPCNKMSFNNNGNIAMTFLGRIKNEKSIDTIADWLHDGVSSTQYAQGIVAKYPHLPK